MAGDYRIVVNVNGSETKGAYGGGTLYKAKTTLNSKRRTENGGGTSQFNLNRVLTIGLLFNKAQQAGELVSAYTENRLQQRGINQGMTALKYTIGFYINPVAGAVYAGGDIAYRLAQYGIKTQKKNREANYYRRLSGNTSASGRRYRGDY